MLSSFDSSGHDERVLPDLEPTQAVEALLDQRALDRLRRRQLMPLEARLLIWEGTTLLDARTAQEFSAAHITGAEVLPIDQGDRDLSQWLPDRSAPILCYSNGQTRSQSLVERLSQLG
ncbi:rhodanese-like domain-containing protein [Cyanobium sp. Morenito 9A2]|uniref:rhodanese-like domain-containing protein n=1 Tax=Cyanobium sp. Morenito 9A2 TaxID=2823718 RepID=UPI0020CC3616|nr:rhodanese-like domain-containing protein [Cyanobium sp. Morenito 9A2]MCP9848491.1 rhodanese-like domain-containing protein [Cyanobium sp. Morenito 9A2]